MRIVQLNLAYDHAISDPQALLDRYHTLTGWSRAVRSAGAAVRVVQRFATDVTIARDGIDYDFRCDGGPPIPDPSGWSTEVIDAVRAYRPQVIHVNGLMFPAMVVAPAAEVRKVAGKVMSASRPAGSAAAQFAGCAPLKILRWPEVPIVA